MGGLLRDKQNSFTSPQNSGLPETLLDGQPFKQIRAVLKLMLGLLIRAAERWRTVKVTEFERRQLAVAQTTT
jgi:hypothetical protein